MTGAYRRATVKSINRPGRLFPGTENTSQVPDYWSRWHEISGAVSDPGTAAKVVGTKYVSVTFILGKPRRHSPPPRNTWNPRRRSVYLKLSSEPQYCATLTTVFLPPLQYPNWHQQKQASKHRTLLTPRSIPPVHTAHQPINPSSHLKPTTVPPS